MDAIVITIGDEILSGRTVDTDAAYISRRLCEIGIDVTKRCTVGDNADDMEREIRAGLDNFDVVITTGGLGPTDDDITKSVICRVFDTQLVERPEILASLEARYKQLNLTMSHLARGMAMQPAGATLLPNPLGTAPGILFERNGAVFCSMAGVPAEMREIVDTHLVPFFQSRGTGRSILYKEIATFGIPESKLAIKIEEAGYTLGEGCRLAYLPSYAGVVLRLRAEAPTKSEAEARLKVAFEDLREIVLEHIFSTESETLIENLVRHLKAKRVTVATAESCTGGLVAKLLTDFPGSSEYFLQGAVTYSNESKINRLGVSPKTIEDYGAVSEETCREMATSMRLLAGSDYAVAVTGVAGPDGGTDEKPVGMVFIGVADKSGVEVRRINLAGSREIIRERSANTALFMLRSKLLAG